MSENSEICNKLILRGITTTKIRLSNNTFIMCLICLSHKSIILSHSIDKAKPNSF